MNVHIWVRRLTLVVELEDAYVALWCGAVVDGQSVGGTADHLTFDQQRVIGQDHQGSLFICTPDRQQLTIWQVHALNLNT